MTTIEDIASTLRDDAAAVHLLYAYNSARARRLSHLQGPRQSRKNATR